MNLRTCVTSLKAKLRHNILSVSLVSNVTLILVLAFSFARAQSESFDLYIIQLELEPDNSIYSLDL